MRLRIVFAVLLILSMSTAAAVTAQDLPTCADLPDHAALTAALIEARQADNGGFDLDMWATIVSRDGEVCAVAFTGENWGDQWPGSRVISAQKANTANAFSLPGLALSTANLFTATQPGGSLYGLQHSNPVDTAVAYGGDAALFGSQQDPMVGHRIGGVNVFGGGLPLYASDGTLLGALGVSGDSSCADHNIAWRTRDALGLDYVPAGVSATGDDNIIYDIEAGVSAGGFGHPVCAEGVDAIGDALPEIHPLGE
ncbi:MAG: heme-binding protein [Chloroflexi bacterium]|nr:heme-binding protein [Chloroflexota bacterium]